MTILKEERQAEITVKKSRFIAIARICNDISAVKTLVDQTRALHSGATHVVHAAVIGNQFSFSDDREPKNTAGRPAFEVLKGSGISNICVLIVRYFGGTLLGTGGLVKAYGDAVKAVLDGIVTEEYVEKTDFSLTVPYDLYESAKRVLSSVNATVSKEDFASEITLRGQVPLSSSENLQSSLSEISNGKITAILTKD